MTEMLRVFFKACPQTKIHVTCNPEADRQLTVVTLLGDSQVFFCKEAFHMPMIQWQTVGFRNSFS